MEKFETVIIGAGACGLMCAAQAGLLGKKTLLIEGNKKPGAKILISGGGRCNFTNLYTDIHNFVSENPKFLHGVFNQWTVEDTIRFFKERNIIGHEKTLGQLFPTTNKARDVVKTFTDIIEETGQKLWLETKAEKINKTEEGFEIVLNREGKSITIFAQKLVLTTGGLPVAKMGATDFALRVARQFGHSIVSTAPALVPLTITGKEQEWYAALSGNSVFSKVYNDKIAFEENILFTHWGLSGPAILQISSYWRPGEQIFIDLLPGEDMGKLIQQERDRGGAKTVKQLIKPYYTNRFIEAMEKLFPLDTKIASLGKKKEKEFVKWLHQFEVKPAGDKGYDKAEVMRGGIQTDELNPRTLESKLVENLYFGGECVDITGWLGGYNFQWAWAAGYVIAQDV